MHQSKKDVSMAFSPIDLLKDLEFRRGVQPAFKSTTRNNWQEAHASKTNPPDVGKYTPKYDALDTDQKATVFVKEHDQQGVKNIIERETQHTHVCLQQIKRLNYPVKDARSQAPRLAKNNKKLNEREEH